MDSNTQRLAITASKMTWAVLDGMLTLFTDSFSDSTQVKQTVAYCIVHCSGFQPGFCRTLGLCEHQPVASKNI